MSPICCVCGEELVDWEGNVMVNSHRYFSDFSEPRWIAFRYGARVAPTELIDEEFSAPFGN